MPGDQAFIDSYDQVETTVPAGDVDVGLPAGERFVHPPLALGEAVRLWRCLLAAEAGDGDAVVAFLDEFPAAFQKAQREQIERLQIPEVFDLGRRFLGHRRAVRPPSPATMEPQA